VMPEKKPEVMKVAGMVLDKSGKELMEVAA
jgi:hypothetical protein